MILVSMVIEGMKTSPLQSHHVAYYTDMLTDTCNAWYAMEKQRSPCCGRKEGDTSEYTKGSKTEQRTAKRVEVTEAGLAWRMEGLAEPREERSAEFQSTFYCL